MEADELHNLLDIFSNRVLWCAVTAWFVAQAMKIPTYWFVERKWDLMRFFGSGGMPSSHTAFVVSLAIMIGAVEGFHTSLFALSVVLAAVVMYDATGVRKETGNQAEILNEILRKVFVNGEQIANDDLKELVGHTKVEVLGGAVVGVMCALAFIIL